MKQAGDFGCMLRIKCGSKVAGEFRHALDMIPYRLRNSLASGVAAVSEELGHLNRLFVNF